MAPSGSGSKRARQPARHLRRVSQMRRSAEEGPASPVGDLGALLSPSRSSSGRGVRGDQRQANTPSLAAVKTFKYDAGAHTESAVAYKETPPVGGEHHPVWLNCGVYDEQVRSENAVHSMEHGAVWITYQPDLAQADVDTLEDIAPDTYSLLSPYEGLPAPVVVSAWGTQLALTGADDPRLEEFIKKYRQGPQTPEPGALCTNGSDGSDLPPPAAVPSPAASATTSPSASTPPAPVATPSPAAS